MACIFCSGFLRIGLQFRIWNPVVTRRYNFNSLLEFHGFIFGSDWNSAVVPPSSNQLRIINCAGKGETFTWIRSLNSAVLARVLCCRQYLMSSLRQWAFTGVWLHHNNNLASTGEVALDTRSLETDKQTKPQTQNTPRISSLSGQGWEHGSICSPVFPTPAAQ